MKVDVPPAASDKNNSYQQSLIQKPLLEEKPFRNLRSEYYDYKTKKDYQT
jgi:hypothetical protein